MNLPEIRAMVLSDVHTGHATTPTENIVKNLKHCVTKSFKEYQPQYLFITGDFFDRLLTLPSNASSFIQSFITWLLRKCKTHSVKLRVLEGTPSHDWKQNYLFVQINQDSKIEADVRYYDKLDIDYEEDAGIHILYVPDEWDESTAETERQVRELLVEKGLNSVDLATMHGMFEFQIPSHLAKSLPLHNQEAYESFVDYLIVIGHDHRHKRNNKVVVPGSFDRITHGEEDPKGYLQFKLKPGKKTEVMFLENTAAEIYRSIDVTDLGLEEALEVIDTVINTLPINAKVRLIYKSNSPLNTHLQELAKKYTDTIWSKPKIVKDEVVEESIQITTPEYTAVILNRENLEDKLMDAIASRHQIDEHAARLLIRDVISAIPIR